MRKLQNLRNLALGVLAGLFFLYFLAPSALARPAAQASTGMLDISLEFLNEYRLPKQQFRGTPVGGLSGITFDRRSLSAENPGAGTYYAISDDRSDKAPARFYTLEIEVTGDRLQKVEVKNVTSLTNRQGEFFERGTIDPEGIALTAQKTLYISSEGVTSQRIPAFIDEFSLDSGTWLRSLPIPTRYLPDAADKPPRGIADNLGFESLTLVQDAIGDPLRVFGATESSLLQDRTPDSGSMTPRSRFLHYVVGIGQPFFVSEHIYTLAPTPNMGMNGLTDVMAIDRAGHFLSLERSYRLGQFGARIFQIATAEASDISAYPSLPADLPSVKPIRKQLAIDLGKLGIRLDNLEGMTLGPRLRDGSSSLILVSDDNFNDFQITQFLLFRLNIRPN